MWEEKTYDAIPPIRTEAAGPSIFTRDDDGGPLFVVTVDTPHYRSRLAKTLSHITVPCFPIPLYDLSTEPTLSCRTVLYAGWRDILLPSLQKQMDRAADTTDTTGTTGTTGTTCTTGTGRAAVEMTGTIGAGIGADGFVLIAEDDIRFCPGVGIDCIRKICKVIFAADDTEVPLHTLTLHCYT